jgi:Fuc2NAc and GlcNAc transferase
MLLLSLLSLLIFALSWAITGLLRKHALSRSMLDIPNNRSSHTIPTPRGGGLAIVLVFLPTLGVLTYLGLTDFPLASALMVSGTATALMGFLDDKGHIPAGWRLAAHLAAAAWVLFSLGGFPPVFLLGYPLPMAGLGFLFGSLYLAWMLNLYNFMDGIDGIAGIQAISTCLAASFLYLLIQKPEHLSVPFTLAMATAGFLVWNFPKAHIFMGDAGSGFLGLCLAALSLHAAWIHPPLFWAWLILMGVFIVDATLTLIVRMIRGERLHEAHRTHSYQHAARRLGTHKPVTLTVAAINVFWLFPLAAAVTLEILDGFLGLAIAWLPLVILAFMFRAGRPEKTSAVFPSQDTRNG